METMSSSFKASLKKRGVKLHAAIEIGDLEAIKSLIANGADVEETDQRYDTPLGLAIELNRADIVDILLNAGAFPELGSWTSPLEEASIKGNAEIVNMLLNAGADVNTRLEKNTTALISAAAYGRFEIVKILIAAGADVNAVDRKADFALSAAIYSGNKNLARYLFDKTSPKLQKIAMEDQPDRTNL